MPNENKDQNINPYLDGRREWNERYGNYIKQVKTWKTVTFISLFITLVSILGLIYIGSKNKLVPYVVEVDKLGAIQAINYAKQSNINNQSVIKYSLADFIQNFKTIYGDAKVQKEMIFKIYRYLSPSYSAYNVVNNYYQDHSPFERLTKERVRVQINSVVKINEDTYQVDWEEIVSDPKGIKIRTDNFKASLTILTVPPTTESEIIKNPIGLFIKEFNFTKIIK